MALIKRDTSLPGFWNDFFDNDDFFGNRMNMLGRLNQSSPAVNIRETDKEFVIEMAAPGIPKENINVELEDDMLTISGEHRSENTSGGGNSRKDGDSGQDNARYTRREFSYSSFNRSFRLPQSVNPEEIRARCENGILEVTVPKREDVKPQKRKIAL